MKMHAFENKHDHQKGFLTAGQEKVGISDVHCPDYKGQLILKELFAILEFFQKTNETIR